MFRVGDGIDSNIDSESLVAYLLVAYLCCHWRATFRMFALINLLCIMSIVFPIHKGIGRDC